MALSERLLLCLMADRAVEFLDYILAKSLGLICSAGPPASSVMYGSDNIAKSRQWRAALMKTILI